MMRVKICGMKERPNIEAVGQLRPDFIGFIFYPKSPRYVGDSFSIDRPVGTEGNVGVFVNESTEQMIKKLGSIATNIAQLHGTESPDQCAELRAKGITVIKVFSVDDQFDFARTTDYETVADFFLFDTKGKSYGGNAVAFDWKLLYKYNQKLPFFLSGGLNADNIELVSELKNMNLYGLDFNSGVEIVPGRKDVARVEKVLKYVRENL